MTTDSAEQARIAAMARPRVVPPEQPAAEQQAAAAQARAGAMARPIPPPKTQTATEFAQTQTMARPFNEQAWLTSLPKELSTAYKEGGVKAYNEAVRQYNYTARQEESRFREDLRRTDSYLYSVYQEGGAEAYNAAVQKRESDIAAITHRNYITLDDQRMKIKDWNQLDPKYKHIALNDGFVAMDRVIDADIAKYEAAEKAIDNYKTKEGDYDIVKYLEDNKGKEQVLLDAGFSKETVKDASEYSKLGWHQKAWRGMTPWAEEKGETASAAGGAIMAAEIIVPGVYAARHWNDMSSGEKAITIAIDVACLIPFTAAAARGARVVGTAGKAARLAAAASALGREALVQVKAPVNMIIHPVAGVKTTVRELRNIAETIAHPKKIPEAVITTSEGTVRLRISEATTKAEAIAARDMLMEAAGRGEKLFIKMGGRTYELAQSPLMREARKAGGGLVHTTPMGEAFEKGLTVSEKAGMPLKEQGLFVSHEPLPRFAEASGFGKTGERPTFYITSKEMAKSAVPTEKIYRGAAEMELKFPVGTKLPAPKQRIFTRIGPTSQRVDFLLDNPLPAWRIAKLKAEGLIEWAKAPFKEPIKIRGGRKVRGGREVEEGIIKTVKKVKIVNGKKTVITEKWIETGKKAKPIIGIDTKQTQKLSKILKKSGNLDQAENLLRAERIAASTRRVAPALSRVTGRVSRAAINEARQRMSLKSTSRARPVRIPITRASVRLPVSDRLSARAAAERSRAIRERYTGRAGRTERGRERPDIERAERETPRRVKQAREIPERERIERERIEVERPERVRGEREAVRTKPERLMPERSRIPERLREPERPRIPGRARKPGITPAKPTDTEKREIIRTTVGAVTWNMGKLGRKHPRDVWHVRLPDGKHLIVMGAAPEGAHIMADGPGSAYKTTQAIGAGLRREIEQVHGAVKARVTPARTEQGAAIRFTPRLKSVRRGKIYHTKFGNSTLLSRRPLGRRKQN